MLRSPLLSRLALSSPPRNALAAPPFPASALLRQRSSYTSPSKYKPRTKARVKRDKAEHVGMVGKDVPEVKSLLAGLK